MHCKRTIIVGEADTCKHILAVTSTCQLPGHDVTKVSLRESIQQLRYNLGQDTCTSAADKYCTHLSNFKNLVKPQTVHTTKVPGSTNDIVAL